MWALEVNGDGFQPVKSSFAESSDPNLERERRLIAAIIHRAIEDIQITPVSKEAKRQRELENIVVSALKYLFGADHVFDQHCEYIGMDADHLRESILDPNNSRISHTARVNYNKFLRVKYL